MSGNSDTKLVISGGHSNSIAKIVGLVVDLDMLVHELLLEMRIKRSIRRMKRGP